MTHRTQVPQESQNEQLACGGSGTSLRRQLLPALILIGFCAVVADVPSSAAVPAQPYKTHRLEPELALMPLATTYVPDMPWFCILCGCAIAVLLSQLHRVQSQARTAGILEERQRIARELHDTLIQGIHALILALQTSSGRLPGTDRVRKEIDMALDRASDMLDEARDRVGALRVPLPVIDIAQAISDAANTLSLAKLANFSLAVQGTPLPLQPISAEHIYAIARESLANAVAHAKAQTIEVEITYQKSGIRVHVRDDGCGIGRIAGNHTATPRHFGLQGMRERAAQIDAQLKVWCRDGGGTEVALDVPASRAYRVSPQSKLWPQELRDLSGLASSVIRRLISSGNPDGANLSHRCISNQSGGSSSP